ncbi:hypothetical protein [Streptomyces malaysiensis]|uniref:Uncharacterized protein n=1 Tax=Streptomyces malaysiensis subsp. samsunensis TaxID=459658 RepID=A0A9X2RRM5_STRMQ|nr:hypothetical protein [Streptomyces samsunensis]MCQ8828521.1 hypothetical protein [Streptomyces samsunensis]
MSDLLMDRAGAEPQGRPAQDGPFPTWDTYGLDETCDHDHAPHTDRHPFRPPPPGR